MESKNKNNNKSGKELMEEFTRIVYDDEKFKEAIQLDVGYKKVPNIFGRTREKYGVSYNLDWFSNWSNNPQWNHIIGNVLHLVYDLWAISPNERNEDEWVRLFQKVMEDNRLRRID